MKINLLYSFRAYHSGSISLLKQENFTFILQNPIRLYKGSMDPDIFGLFSRYSWKGILRQKIFFYSVFALLIRQLQLVRLPNVYQIIIIIIILFDLKQHI